MNRGKGIRLVVTGANGFIGSALCDFFRRNALEVTGIARGVRPDQRGEPAPLLTDQAKWLSCFSACDVVVHTAAMAGDAAENSLAAFREVNVDATLNLARQAAAAGVRRFIFLSSVKVHGERTEPDQAFTESSPPAPADPYALSKHEAEQGLADIARETGLEVVIIRPPLVYGPGAKGNFQSLLRWISKGIPLPLGATHNRRSLVALDNLVDFILTCIDHPAAANQTFLLSDGEDLSTSELLRRVGQAMGKPARLIPVPMGVLKFGASLLGKQAMAQRLCGNLQVDISKAREVLGWEPPVSVDEGLRRAVRE